MAGKAEYKNQWQKENCDRVNLTLPKGRKAELQAYAAAVGESLNGFIGRAIMETIERDGSGTASNSPPQAAESMAGAGVVSLPPETIKTAQEAAQSVGETVSQFVERAVETQAKRDRSSLAMGINPATGEKLNGGAAE